MTCSSGYLRPALVCRQVIRRVEALEAAGTPPDVVVVGAGYAGVEVAASLADRFHGAACIKIVTAGMQAWGFRFVACTELAASLEQSLWRVAQKIRDRRYARLQCMGHACFACTILA